MFVAVKPIATTASLFDIDSIKIKASSRIVVEHINAKIKTFQIFTQKYRNRRKKFGLRLNLICALINADRAID